MLPDESTRIFDATEAIEDEVPFIYEVTSLANAELTVGTEDGIEISKIVDDWPLSQAELLERREAYLRKPMLVGGIINEEADFGALILEMDRSSTLMLQSASSRGAHRPTINSKAPFTMVVTPCALFLVG